MFSLNKKEIKKKVANLELNEFLEFNFDIFSPMFHPQFVLRPFQLIFFMFISVLSFLIRKRIHRVYESKITQPRETYREREAHTNHTYEPSLTHFHSQAQPSPNVHIW